MSAKNPKAGRGPCPCCGESVLFRKSATGRLTYSCDHCDHSGYSEPGGAAHKKWLAALTPEPGSEPPSAPAPEPAPAPPAPQKRNSVFNLGAL